MTWDHVLEQLEDGICLLSPELNIVRINPAFAELIGEQIEQLIGRPGNEVMQGLGRRGILSTQSSKSGDIEYSTDRILDHLLENPDSVQGAAGEKADVPDYQRLRTTLVALSEENGDLFGYLLVLRDSSGAVAHEREIARAEQLARLGELAASLAHEIRNPLAGIQGAVDILIGRRAPEDPERKVLEGVRNEVARIDETIRKLLVHARPREAHTRLTLLSDPVRRAVILGRSHASYLKRTQGKSIRILFSGDQERLSLLIDELLIEDAVLNLILNAIESIEESGAIRVSVRRQDPLPDRPASAIIEIEDTGCGITEENLSRIFAPFYTTSPNGTGLGLPAVRRIVRGHSGSIEVESTPGRGSTFRIRLPIQS